MNDDAGNCVELLEGATVTACDSERLPLKPLAVVFSVVRVDVHGNVDTTNEHTGDLHSGRMDVHGTSKVVFELLWLELVDGQREDHRARHSNVHGAAIDLFWRGTFSSIVRRTRCVAVSVG